MWPFSRKPKPLNPGPINEDWAYGDLAQLVTAGEWCDADSPQLISRAGPETGDVSKVLAVKPMNTRTIGPVWFIQIGGFHGWFDASSFRKVPPLNSAADAEFSALVKRGRKVRA